MIYTRSMKIIIDQQKINNLIERTERVYPSEKKLRTFLESGKRLTVYHGVDPTASFLHLGHTVSLYALKRFQELGHKVILLIGDFTAQIGDPTGKGKSRKPLSDSEISKNYKDYREQAGKILNFEGENPAFLMFNSKWWREVDSRSFLNLLSTFTVQRMLERDMFQKRQEKGLPIWMHEFVYPLLQGYDSVAMDVDVEIGGTDQIFNMLVGRDLLKIYKNKEKIVVAMPLLIAEKSGKKMSKSEGGVIALKDSSKNMYGKIMALSDEIIIPCFKSCTENSIEEINKIEKNLKEKKVNPRDVKARLAREIVKIYHGEAASSSSEKEFERVFKEKKLPSEVSKVFIGEKEINILDLLVKIKVISSKSEAKRLILQKGIKIDGQIQEDWRKKIKIKKGMVVRAGKRRVVQIG